MSIDRGDIVGGFERKYNASIVQDQGARNPPASPEQQSSLQATVGGVSRDGVISVAIETELKEDYRLTVTLEQGRSWSRRLSVSWFNDSAPCLFTTPDPLVLGVRVRGYAFAVDVLGNGDAVMELPVLPLTCAASDIAGRRQFLASDLYVYCFDGKAILWRSRRVSLDGISELAYRDGQVIGTATDVGIDAVPFTIDPRTGAARAGFTGWREPKKTH